VETLAALGWSPATRHERLDDVQLILRRYNSVRPLMDDPTQPHAGTGLAGQLIAEPEVTALPGTWDKTVWQHGWYLPNVNVYPLRQAVFSDLSTVVREHVLPGHRPAAPMLTEADSVVTLGSCFARELRLYLSESGVESTRFWIPSGLNNTFALLDFFSWCVTGSQTARGYRYERTETGQIREWTPQAERRAYAASLAEAGAFVFTIGLAEVWQDGQSGACSGEGCPRTSTTRSATCSG